MLPADQAKFGVKDNYILISLYYNLFLLVARFITLIK